MRERAFLDFYDSLPTVPVNQSNAGTLRHFCQRSALYRTLGITPLTIKGSNVLEVGPGSGDNAIHTVSLQPNAIHFIDGAKPAVRAINEKIASGVYGDIASVEHLDVAQNELSGSFDIVFCEGLLPGQATPTVFFHKLLSVLNQGGICVITTVSPVSYLAEVCRRILLPIVKQHSNSDDDLLSNLVTLFKPGLDSLTGMSRSHRDWVLDNIIHPWTDKGCFTIEQAINTLPSGYSVLGSSPAFLQDWSWYKQYNEERNSNTDIMLKSYQKWAGFLLDYRSSAKQTFSFSEYEELERLCEKAMNIQDEYRQTDNKDSLNEFVVLLTEVKALVVEKMPETTQSIDDYISALPELLAGNLQANFNSFHHWFGRGQQYVSVIRDV